MFEKYKNISGKSSILGYIVGNDYVDVIFKSNDAYRYSYRSAGKYCVDSLIDILRKGNGANRFIRTNCFGNFESKYRYK